MAESEHVPEGHPLNDDSKDKSTDEQPQLVDDPGSAKPGNEELPRRIMGAEPRVKKLYPGPPKCDCHTNWVEEYPDDVPPVIEASEDSESCAILARWNFPHGESSPDALVLDSVVIQSAIIKAALAKALKGYPGFVFNVPKLKLYQPFDPLFHRWTEIIDPALWTGLEVQALVSDPKSDAAKSSDRLPADKEEGGLGHLELLKDAVGHSIGRLRKSYEELLADNVISFDLLWTLFPPGELVFVPGEAGHERIMRIKSAKMVEKMRGGVLVRKLEIAADYVDWSGVQLGYREHEVEIGAFSRPMLITSLEIYPLKYAKNENELREKLEKRGRRFVALSGVYHKLYKSADQWATGRMILDGVEAENESWRFSRSVRSFTDETANDSNENEDLTPEQFLLCNYSHTGYSLSQKKWREFDVDCILDVEWDEDAFSSLVLPGDYKEVFLSLVNAQADGGDAEKTGFDDVISGKGRGYVMLLSGPPGVGKTLTAESVAEEMRLPLYSISAGELGSEIDEIENGLKNILRLSARWKAVLLIDEADIYLEARTNLDVMRNRLVSVFLRQLEYHQGLLFLTTNRSTTIDPALESRVHLSVAYPDLDITSREMIWSNFAVIGEKRGMVSIEPTDLKSLAGFRLNGRQIKNTYKTAYLLARRKKEVVTVQHLERAIRITNPEMLSLRQRVDLA